MFIHILERTYFCKENILANIVIVIQFHILLKIKVHIRKESMTRPVQSANFVCKLSLMRRRSYKHFISLLWAENSRR